MFNGIDCPNKRAIQKEFYSQVDKSRLMGLGGESVETYADLLRRSGFRSITLYENNKDIFVNQLRQYKGGYQLIFGDILYQLNQDAFYDLDFCCSPQQILPFLPTIFKIKQLMLTVSIRPLGEKNTLDLFSLFDKTFSYQIYRDTVPMLTILKQQS